MSNEAKARIFICPNCGGTFERKIKKSDNIMKCSRCKPRIQKGKTDCVPCRKKRGGG